MGLGFIIAGMIFLFNPFISVYDILPDVIGYAFIVYGLSKFADIELKVTEAKRRMTSALYIAAGRMVVMLGAVFMEFDSTLILVFTFSFAALEMFFVIPAFNMFFEGMEYTCLRFSENAIEKRSEDLRKITPIFLIVRSAAAVIPELTSLTTDYGYVGDEVGLDNSGVLRVMLMALCTITALVFGIVWLTTVLPYLKKLRRNSDFLAYVKERYESAVLSNKVLQMQRSVKRFTSLWFAALFFITCIPMDGYYIIPEFICGALMLLGLMFAKRYVAEYKKTFTVCAAATATMLLAYTLLYRYSDELGYAIYPYKVEGFEKYFLPYIVVAVIGYAMMIWVCKKGNAALKSMVDDCVGVRDTADTRRKEIDEYRKKELGRFADRLFIFQCVAFAGSIIFMIAMPWFALSWTARTILSVIAIIYAYNVFHDITEEAEKAL